jgi:hypothetical protein
MKGIHIIKCGILVLLWIGLISCSEQNAVLPQEEPEEVISETPEKEPYAVVSIENLQTRLRILDPDGKYSLREHLWQSDLKDPVTGEHLWRWDPKNVIIHFPPKPERYEIDTHFGYVNGDRMLLCEVINFPEAALQWKEDFSSGLGSLLEVNVQMSGTVRLYIDNTGEKYGTLELTSLEPSGARPANLQFGVYTETYPKHGRTQINFIDKETLEIKEIRDGEVYRTDKWKYETGDNYTINLTEEGAVAGGELFFRVISDSKFEMDYVYIITAENGPPIMAFEKENISNN